VGDLDVNWTTRTVLLRGEPLPLTTGEFELLGLLVRNRGRVLTRERIMDQTRGVDWEAYDRSIDVLVSRLRQKLGDDARQPVFIRTIRGTGYSYIGGDRD
jgi:DNA-binding response OmpR family regulator